MESDTIGLMGTLAVGTPAAFLEAERIRQEMQPRRAIVESLEDLVGPQDGVVTLPLRIDWSTTKVYDLNDPVRLASMYAIVLREALNVEDLKSLLNAEILRGLWPTLRLPNTIRQMWEQAHPELRAR